MDTIAGVGEFIQKYIDDSFNHNYKSICSCCPKCSGKVCADCNPIKKNSHADV